MSVKFSANFKSVFAELNKQIDAKKELIFEQAVINFADRIIEKSPVGRPDLWESTPPKDYAEGHYVANWQFVESVSDAKEIDDIDPDTTYTREKLHHQIRDLVKSKKLKQFRLVNAAPYAQQIEDGWAIHNFHTPPQGVMATTLLEWDDCIKDAEAKIGKYV